MFAYYYGAFHHGGAARQKLGSLGWRVLPNSAGLNALFVDGHAALKTVAEFNAAPAAEGFTAAESTLLEGIDTKALVPAK